MGKCSAGYASYVCLLWFNSENIRIWRVSWNRKQTLDGQPGFLALTVLYLSVFSVSLFNKPKCCLKTFSIFHPERLPAKTRWPWGGFRPFSDEMQCFSCALLLLFPGLLLFLFKHALWAHTAEMLFPDPCLRKYLTRTLNVGQTHLGRGQRKGNRKCSSIFLWPYRLPPIGRAEVMSQGKMPKLKGWKWV